MLKSNLKVVFRREALTPHNPKPITSGTGPCYLRVEDARPVQSDMWRVMQIINREAEFLFRIDVVGKKKRKFTHLKRVP